MGYCVTTNVERFAPLYEVATRLVEYVNRVYEVSASEERDLARRLDVSHRTSFASHA